MWHNRYEHAHPVQTGWFKSAVDRAWCKSFQTREWENTTWWCQTNKLGFLLSGLTFNPSVNLMEWWGWLWDWFFLAGYRWSRNMDLTSWFTGASLIGFPSHCCQESFKVNLISHRSRVVQWFWQANLNHSDCTRTQFWYLTIFHTAMSETATGNLTMHRKMGSVEILFLLIE